MEYAQWLTFIEGKDVSPNVLQDVKERVAGVVNRKQLFESIVTVMKQQGYADDDRNTTARYIYEHILGFHIESLDLSTENIILEEFSKIQDVLREDVYKIPNIYILQQISTKRGLGLRRTVEYPLEKRKYYDALLEFYINSIP